MTTRNITWKKQNLVIKIYTVPYLDLWIQKLLVKISKISSIKSRITFLFYNKSVKFISPIIVKLQIEFLREGFPIKFLGS